MIVKNEARNLAHCLGSIQTIADEIIIVDTGSTDQTRTIASEFTDKIHHFEWCDDFSAARNFGLTKAKGDWILIIDADQTLPDASKEWMRQELNKGPATLPLVYNARLLTPGKHALYAARLFPNHLGIHYKGRIHEAPAYQGKWIPAQNCPDFVMNHLSKVSEQKTHYYEQLLHESLRTVSDEEERLMLWLHLGRHYQEKKHKDSAFQAFSQAQTHYLALGWNKHGRLYHNILEPLVRLSIEKGEISWALKQTQDLNQYFPEFVEGSLYRAYCHFWRGELAESSQWYQTCLAQLKVQTLPKPVYTRTMRSCQIGLARILALNGELQAGSRLFEALFGQHPERELALHLSRLYALQIQEEKARQWYHTALNKLPTPTSLEALNKLYIWSPAEATQMHNRKSLIA